MRQVVQFHVSELGSCSPDTLEKLARELNSGRHPACVISATPCDACNAREALIGVLKAIGRPGAHGFERAGRPTLGGRRAHWELTPENEATIKAFTDRVAARAPFIAALEACVCAVRPDDPGGSGERCVCSVCGGNIRRRAE